VAVTPGGAAGRPPADPASGGPWPALRVGQGFDIHPFGDDPDRPLVLGGVVVPDGPGLVGHSDADVVAHALADAVLGAAGLGDLGRHFPADQAQWAGADSLDLLARSVAMARAAGWRPVNGQCTAIAERPRLGPHLPAMSERCGEVLGAPVAVTAKRAEGLGALGRVEGIATLAVVLLVGDDLLAGNDLLAGDDRR
jgi:2-C-methyl-D-erythritol 2,4-cyclodiphosphate synthase